MAFPFRPHPSLRRHLLAHKTAPYGLFALLPQGEGMVMAFNRS
jgi:hypothetical protein